MLKRIAASLCLMVAMLSTSARAQNQPGDNQGPSDDQMAMMQAMQPVFQTIMQNMQDKGIDPRQFFQQMQNGTDPAEMQKQLIDQGLIDQKTLDQMNASVQTIQSSSIKRQLNATDEEWKTLWPLIQKVMKASAAVNGSRPQAGGGMGGMGMGGFMTSGPAKTTELTLATKALHAAIKDPGTDASQFASVLKDYRNARTQAQSNLSAARQDLLAVLTTRQEAVLTNLGIIE